MKGLTMTSYVKAGIVFLIVGGVAVFAYKLVAKKV
jgi:hypothetical protein